MNIDDRKKREYMGRLAKARMSILYSNGFYGLLLMHMRFALDDSLETAATDGVRIYFAPMFMDMLSDRELVFILEHEILHIVLKHAFRSEKRNNILYNIATDIVVNSCILHSHDNDISSITVREEGVSMHLAPDGKEGHLYTVEKVYEMLLKSGMDGERPKLADEHSRWGSEQDKTLEDEWRTRITDAYEAARRGHGRLPAQIERMIEKLVKPKVNWRRILHLYAQPEPGDYTFNPPDSRYQESPFIFPSFSEFEEKIRNVLFMIDTSASISDDQMVRAYSEVKGAVDQYGNRLEGWLGFFDSMVYDPKPFRDAEDLLRIRPVGGGGTSFRVIFNYVREHMDGMDIACIIVLTDGYADFPKESESGGIPVIWAMNNESVTPPWGRTIKLDK